MTFTSKRNDLADNGNNQMNNEPKWLYEQHQQEFSRKTGMAYKKNLHKGAFH